MENITTQIHKIEDVFGCVWLATAMLTFDKCLSQNINSINKINLQELGFQQSVIQQLAQTICLNEVQGARVSQWCNFDHNQYRRPFLREVGQQRRLLFPNETEIDLRQQLIFCNEETIIFNINATNKNICIRDFLNWYFNEFENCIDSFENKIINEGSVVVGVSENISTNDEENFINFKFKYKWVPFEVNGEHLIFNNYLNQSIRLVSTSHNGAGIYKWKGQLTEGKNNGKVGILIGETENIRQRLNQYKSGTQENGNRYWRENFLILGEIKYYILETEEIIMNGEIVDFTEIKNSKSLRGIFENLLIRELKLINNSKVWLVNKD